MKRKTWIVIGTFIIFILIVIISSHYYKKTSQTKVWSTIRIGYLPIAAELPLFVAIEQGYFKEAGISFELIRLASSNEMGNAATADKIDILAGAATNVIFDIGNISGKKHLLFVLNPYSNAKGHITDYLIVRKNSGITSISELKGKKIASFPGSVNRIFTYLVLEKYNVPRTNYQYFELLPKDWEPALQSGTIDAVSALEPQATQIIKDGVGVPIFNGFYAELMPDVPLSGHWISSDFYKRADKSQLSSFLNAYNKAIIFIREHEVMAKSYLVKYAGVREDIISDVNLNPWKIQSEISSKNLQTFVNILVSNKVLQSNVNIHEYLLTDYLIKK